MPCCWKIRSSRRKPECSPRPFDSESHPWRSDFPRVVFWADSRRRIGLFRNVILKPNQIEGVRAVFADPAIAIDEETASAAARTLAARTGKPVFLTRADQGILVADGSRLEWAPAFPVRGPIDPTGAGASASAAAVLALVSGATLIEAAMAANLVGSITVEQIGKCGVASRAQVAERLDRWRAESSVPASPAWGGILKKKVIR